MYFENEQQYMSEPVDEMSESSYIKINKRFLQCLKGVNDMDDLSRFRHDSDDDNEQDRSDNIVNNHSQLILDKQYEEQNDQSSKQQQEQSQQQQREVYSTSPHEHRFYNNFYQQKCSAKIYNHEKSINNNQRKSYFDNNLASNSYSNKLYNNISPKISHNHSKIDKKQTTTPNADNTFEYYLMRRSHSNKYKNIQKNQMNDSQNQQNQKSTRYNKPFSPQQNRFSASNRFAGDASFNLQSQMQRINYKKLLENQITKNKQLQRHIYKLQSKLTELNLQYDQSFKSTKKLQQNLINSQKVRKQNRHRMKQLDGKLQGLKSVFKEKKSQNQQKILNYRKQNKLLKQQNQKYRIFVQSLSESIFILKGHKPKKLEDIWDEWKLIFQTFSKKKWTKSRGKSPNFKV